MKENKGKCPNLEYVSAEDAANGIDFLSFFRGVSKSEKINISPINHSHVQYFSALLSTYVGVKFVQLSPKVMQYSSGWLG